MESLVESSLPLVFSTYDQALRDRVREPVVLLVDCEDAIGREIAEAWLGAEAVEDSILAVHAERDGDPESDDDWDEDEQYTAVFARAMPREECRRELPPVFPYLGGGFDGLPADAVLVVVVSAGGAGTFIVPFSSRPDLSGVKGVRGK